MLEQINAQVVEHPLADPARHVRLDPGQADADDADADHDTADDQQELRVTRDDRRVDRRFHQEWQGQRASQHAEHRSDRTEEAQAIRDDVRTELADAQQALLAFALARDDLATGGAPAAAHETLSSWPTGMIT